MSSLLPLDDEPIAVIPAQAGIRKFKVMAALKSFRNAEAWIPACAGMTMDKGFFEFFKVISAVVFVGKAHATVGLSVGCVID